MKINYNETDNGYQGVEIVFSYKDIVENGLEDCFSVNTMQKPTLIKKSKFNNFVNNYLVNEIFLKERLSNIYSNSMLYKIYGDSDNFITVYLKVSSGNNPPVVEFEDVIERVRDNVNIDTKAGDKYVWDPNISNT